MVKRNEQQVDGRKLNVRLSPIDHERLKQLIKLHRDTESNILRDALTLKWYVDIGFKELPNEIK